MLETILSQLIGPYTQLITFRYVFACQYNAWHNLPQAQNNILCAGLSSETGIESNVLKQDQLKVQSWVVRCLFRKCRKGIANVWQLLGPRIPFSISRHLLQVHA